MTLNAIKNTLFIGNIWYHFDTLHSTNDLAAEWLSLEWIMDNGQWKMENGKSDYNSLSTIHYPLSTIHYPLSKITEGVVLTTFNQTAGRGQMGNQWLAEPDQNIAFSVILQPTFLDAREQFHLNKAIALAVHDCIVNILKQYKPALANGCRVKWANDIYVYDEKIAGILIQNALSGSRLQHTIVGIGLNINQLDFPNNFNATSLKRVLERDFDLFSIVEQLAKAIEYRYLQLKTGNFRSLHDEYLSKLYRFNEESLFQYPNGTPFRGTIIGVSAAGRLEVLTTEGVKNFDIKELKFVIED
jgi:BirA family transcriptional regulator, biotin operon repressor / biotin---[acetyl-CoA-carboxylase] ligase